MTINKTAQSKRITWQTIQQPKEKGQKDKQYNSPKKKDRQHNDQKKKRTKGQTAICKNCFQ
jgi:hypothetical protein